MLFVFYWVYVYFSISRCVNMSVNFFVSRKFLYLKDFMFGISSLIFSNDFSLREHQSIRSHRVKSLVCRVICNTCDLNAVSFM